MNDPTAREAVSEAAKHYVNNQANKPPSPGATGTSETSPNLDPQFVAVGRARNSLNNLPVPLGLVQG